MELGRHLIDALRRFSWEFDAAHLATRPSEDTAACPSRRLWDFTNSVTSRGVVGPWLSKTLSWTEPEV
jgi:hypothetical protein